MSVTQIIGRLNKPRKTIYEKYKGKRNKRRNRQLRQIIENQQLHLQLLIWKVVGQTSIKDFKLGKKA